jgi:hypothetical protein
MGRCNGRAAHWQIAAAAGALLWALGKAPAESTRERVQVFRGGKQPLEELEAKYF